MRPSFRAPRLLALAAGLLAADPASAQRVDAGLSAGFSRTSRWYETEGDPGSLAGGPALSADLRYWPVPVAGVRLQAGTFSGSLRTTRPESQRVLGIAYDASVVVRPLTESPGVPDPLASAYAYAGGGAVTLALSGEPDSIRTCPPKSDTGCVVLRARSATVAQFTAGAGTEVPLGGGLAVYVEGSVTAYEPPFRRRGPTGSSQMMSSRGAISPPSLQLGHPGMAVATPGSLTSRLVIGLRRTFGIRAPPPVVPPAALVVESIVMETRPVTRGTEPFQTSSLQVGPILSAAERKIYAGSFGPILADRLVDTSATW